MGRYKFYIAVILFCLVGSLVQANPLEGDVIHGQAGFASPDANTLNITNTPGTIINWQQFSIRQNETTRFIQQSANSTILNRVKGQDPSNLMGQLLSNGRVFLINRNGVVFGENAMIDTAGFIASTLDMTNEDFINGKLKFQGENAGAIQNMGYIKAGANGDIFLIAPNIENSGIIETQGGEIILAAGESIIIASLDSDNIVFEVQAPDNEIVNLGEVITNGGAAKMFAGSIKHSGSINADSITVDKQGRVQIFASSNIDISGDAAISASGAEGGEIRIAADNDLIIAEGAQVVATGSEGDGGFISMAGAESVVVTTDYSVNALSDEGENGWLYIGQNADAARTIYNPNTAPDIVGSGYGALPLSFEENQGQTAEEVDFISRGSGYSLFLTPAEAVAALSQLGEDGESTALRLSLIGGKENPNAVGEALQEGISNYFIGDDSDAWVTDVANYGKIRYEEVYEGIDLVYYGNLQGELEYDFEVAAGVDPNKVQLNYTGAEGASINDQGQLVFNTGSGEIIQKAPLTYQVTDDARVLVPSEYVLEQKTEAYDVSFNVDPYDTNNTLVIDPVLVYSTYLGGSGDEQTVGGFAGAHGNRLAVDASGNAYYTGTTASTDFPTLGAVQGSLNGTTDVFVTKLNATGTALVYSTYLGGTGDDRGNGIAIDASGNAYLTGAASSGFPTTAGVFDTTFNGNIHDAFVTKLNASGNGLVYSTYLGGTRIENGNALTVDASGNVYVVGDTQGLSGFPTTAGAFQQADPGGGPSFVTKLDSTGSTLLYSTFVGGGTGGAFSRFHDIVIDGSGNAFVSGTLVGDTGFPTVNAFQASYGGGARDGVLFELNAAGSALNYSTFIGGSAIDQGNGLALDSSGNIIAVGDTASGDFSTFNAFQGALSGTRDAYIVKIDPNQSGAASLLDATYFGGSGTDLIIDVGVAGNDHVYVVGSTASSDLPTAGTLQAYAGGEDAFVTLFDSNITPVFSTFIGGSNDERGNSIAVDSSGDVYIAGRTDSSDYPTTTGTFQTSAQGGEDQFITKIEGPDVYWNTDSSGDWNTAANWTIIATSGTGLPGASDDVLISRIGATPTITHSSGPNTVNTLVSDEAFTLSGGTLTLNDVSTINNILTLSGGSLNAVGTLTVDDINLSAGTHTIGTSLTVNNTLNWTAAATISGGILNLPGTTTLTGDTAGVNNRILSGVTVNNTGTFNFAPVSNAFDNLVLNAGTVFNNQLGGVFDIQTDNNQINSTSGGGTFANFGTLQKTTGGLTEFGTTGTVAFNNTNATVDAQAGTLQLLDDSSFSGTLTLGTNGMSLAGGTHSFADGDAVTGGVLSLSGGSLNAVGTLTVDDINLSAGTHTIGTSLTANNTLNWTGAATITGGILNLPGTTTLSVAVVGINNRILDGVTVNNTGTFNFAPVSNDFDNLVLNNGTVFNNQLGGVFDIQTDNNQINSTSGSGTFANFGTLQKTTGGLTEFGTTGTVAFNNTNATVDAQAGTLQLLDDSSFTGTLTLGTNGLSLAGGTHSFADGDTVTGGVLSLSGGSLNAVGTLTVDDINLSAGTHTIGTSLTVNNTLNWTGAATITGGILNLPGTTTLSVAVVGINNRILDGVTVNNTGTFNFAPVSNDFDNLVLNNGTVFNNQLGGVFDIQTDNNQINSTSGSGTFANFGTLQKTTGGTTQFSATGTVALLNTGGTVDIQSGILSLSGSTLTLDAASTLMGNGILAGNVNNGGTISPGASVGTITIDGNLTLMASSILDIEVDNTPTTAGTDYDLINIINSGNLTISGSPAGTVNLIDISGGAWTPTAGDILDIINCDGTCNPGTFLTVNSPFGFVANQSIVTGSPDMFRLILAANTIFIWDGTGDGTSWDDQFNWTADSGLPTSSDDVLIDLVGTITVVVDSVGQAARQLSMPGSSGIDNLSITAGDLTLDGNSTIAGNLTLSGVSTLTGTGDITLAGLFDWQAGTLQGTNGTEQLNTNGGITLTTAGVKTLDNRIVNNNGTTTMGPDITMSNGAVFNNLVGGIVNMPGTARFTSIGAGGTVNNAGSMVLTGAGALSWGSNVLFHNTGSVDVQGTRTLFITTDNLTTPHTGDFNIESGATYRVNKPTEYAATSDFTGSGTVRIEDGGVGSTLNGSFANTLKIDLSNFGKINFNFDAEADSLVQTGTSVSIGGSGSLKVLTTWTPTSTTTVINGDLIIGSSVNTTINTGNFDGVGSLTVEGTLTHNSGSLDIAPSLTAANLNVTGGTLTGSGDITVTSGMTFSNATIRGSGTFTTNAGTTTTLTGATTSNTDLNDSRAWTNLGTVNFVVGVTDNFRLLGTSSFTNAAGGIFNIDKTDSVSSVTGVGTFSNAGTLNKFTIGQTDFDTPFNNTGTVIINNGSGVLVFGNSGTHTGTFNVIGGTLDFGGGTHNLNTGATLTGAGLFRKSSSALLRINDTISVPNLDLGGLISGGIGGTGTLTVTGNMNWTGGNIGDNTGGTLIIDSTGSLNINVSGAPDINGHTLIHDSTTGTSAWVAGEVDIGSSSGAEFRNNGTFLIQGDGVFLDFNGSGTTGFLRNNGTLTRNTGTGTVTIDTFVNNSGLIDIQTGTWTMQTTGTNTGQYNVDSGAVVDFAPSTAGFTHNLNTGTTLTGAGLFRRSSSGTVSVNDTISVPNLDLGGLISGGIGGTGTLTVTGNMNWTGGNIGDNTGGTLIIDSTGSLNINVSGAPDINGHTLIHDSTTGTSAWVAGEVDIGSSSGAEFRNNGTFLIQGDGVFLDFNGSGTTGFLRNNGTLTRNTGTGTVTIDTFVNNSGLIDIQTGTWTMQTTGTNTGQYNVDSGAVVDFAPSTAGFTHNLNTGTTLTGAGLFRRSSSGTVSVNDTISVPNLDLGGLISGGIGGTGTLTVTGNMNWTGGNIGDNTGGTLIIDSTGSLNINVSGAPDINGHTLIHDSTTGTSAWVAGEVDIGSSSGAEFRNNGTFLIQGDGVFLDFNGSGTTGFLRNNGTLTRNTGTGTVTIDTFVNNSGLIDIQTGTWTMQTTGTNTGQYNVDSGAVVDFAPSTAGFTHNLNTGTTLTGAGLFRRSSSGTVSVNDTISVPNLDLGGLISGGIGGTGTLTVTGNMNWTGGNIGDNTGGTLIIDSTGSLNINVSGAPDIIGHTLQHDSTTSTSAWVAGEVDIGTGSALFDNNGIFHVQGDGIFLDFSGSGTGFIRNDGTLIRDVGTGVVTIDTHVNNTNFIDVQTGTLLMNTTGNNTGLYNVGSGAVVEFAPSSAGFTHNLNTGTTLTGAGLFKKIGAGTLSVNDVTPMTNLELSVGILTVDGAATADTFTHIGGTLNGIGSLTLGTTWSPASGVTVNTVELILSSGISNTLASFTLNGSGTLTNQGTLGLTNSTLNTSLNNQASLNISGTSDVNGPVFDLTSGTIALPAGSILNKTGGNFNWIGGSIGSAPTDTGSLTLLGGAAFNIVGAGARILDGPTINLSTFTLSGGSLQLLSGTLNASGLATIDPGATLQLSGGTFSPAVAISNNGILDIDTGTLSLSNGGTHAGSFDLATGTTLNFSGGIHNLDDNALLTGSGSFTLSGGVSLDAIGTGAGATLAAGNILDYSGLVLDGGGIFNNQGTMIFNNSTMSADIVNTSPVNFTGGTNTITSGNGITMGTVNFTGGTTTFDSGSTYSVAVTNMNSGAIANFNTNMSSTTLDIIGATVQGTGNFTISGLTDISGTSLLAGAGTLFATGGLVIDPSGSTVTLNRNVQVLGGGTWTQVTFGGFIGGSGTVTNTAGSTILLSGANSIDISTDIDNLGTLSKSGNGTITITGALTSNNIFNINAGRVDLNTNNTVTGAFNVASGATLGVTNGTTVFDGFSNVVGAGGLFMTGGAAAATFAGLFNLSGSTAINGGATGTFNTNAAFGSLSLSGGIAQGSGDFNVAGLTSINGTSTIAGGGTLFANSLNIDSSGSTVSLNRNVQVLGGGTWTQVTFGGFIGGSGTVTNTAGSTILLSGANSIDISTDIDNAGTITKTGVGTVSFNGNGTHSGDFNVNAGVLRFGAIHTFNSGSDTSGVGDIAIVGGTSSYNTGSTYSLTGDTGVNGGNVNFNIAASTNTLTHAANILGGTGNLTVNNNWTPTSGVTVNIIDLFLGSSINETLSGITLNGSGKLTNQGTLGLTNSTLNTSYDNQGSLNISGISNVDGATFDLTSGIIALPVGATLNKNSGAFNWISGSIGSGVGDTGSLVMLGGASFNLTGASARVLNGPAVSVNNISFPGGSLDVQSGTFNATGTTTVGTNTTFLNTGGTFSLAALNVNAGSTLSMPTGAITASGLTTISGAGIIDVSGGTFMPTTLTLNDGTLTGSSNVSISGFTTWNDGTMSGSGTTFANGGIDFLGFANRVIDRDVEHIGSPTWTASGSIGGSGLFTHQSGTLTMTTRFFMGDFANNGTVVVDFSTPDLIGFDSVFNEGTFQIVDGVFRIDDVSSSTAGTYSIASGAELLIRDDYIFNGGTISGAGALELDGSNFDIFGGTVGTQDINLIGGTTVDVSGGVFSPTNLTLDDGILTGSTDVTISGLTTWGNGTMDGTGTTFANGGIDFSGSATRVIDRNVEHVGTRTWTPSGSIAGSGTLTHQSGTLTMTSRYFLDPDFVNNGTVVIDVPGDLIGFSNVQNNGTLQINNGTLRIDGNGNNTTGVFTIASGADLLFRNDYSFNGGSISGLGTLEIDGSNFDVLTGSSISPQNLVLTNGIFDIYGGSTSIASSTLVDTTASLLLTSGSFTSASGLSNSGIVDIAPGTFSISGSPYTQSAGMTILSGGTLDASGVGINLNGGSLQGNGNIVGILNNDATVTVGTSPGVIAITGDYIQPSAGVLNLEISANFDADANLFESGEDFDVLTATGNISLDGAVNIITLGGYTGNAGDTFVLMACAGSPTCLSGTFATENLPGGLSSSVFYNASDFTFAFDSTEPSSINDGSLEKVDELINFNVGHIIALNNIQKEMGRFPGDLYRYLLVQSTPLDDDGEGAELICR